MKRKVDFDWYCKTKKDVINNAAYELIVALTAKSAPPRKFELSIPQWDDLMIANIVENAINAIDERIGYYCHPFYHEVDKLPCYLGDRCDNLTYKQFEAIQFRNQGYTNREIAELCGVGRKAIEKRFARIRKILSDYKEN